MRHISFYVVVLNIKSLVRRTLVDLLHLSITYPSRKSCCGTRRSDLVCHTSHSVSGDLTRALDQPVRLPPLAARPWSFHSCLRNHRSRVWIPHSWRQPFTVDEPRRGRDRGRMALPRVGAGAGWIGRLDIQPPPAWIECRVPGRRDCGAIRLCASKSRTARHRTWCGVGCLAGDLCVERCAGRNTSV